MATRYGDAHGWGDISPAKRIATAQLEVQAAMSPISPMPSPRQLRLLELRAAGATLAETAPLSPANPAITTGSDDLDALLGGGVETGRVTEIKGSLAAMLHVCCALAVTTQLPEAAPPNIAESQAPRFYGLKLFGGANGKVMIIDTLGTFLDGRETLHAVCRRFDLDEEAVLDSVMHTSNPRPHLDSQADL